MATDAPVTDRIAAFALGLDLAAVPAAAVQRATRLLADTLGCALAARGEPLAERLAAYARRHSAADAPRATLLVGGGSADLPLCNPTQPLPPERAVGSSRPSRPRRDPAPSGR